MTDTAGLKVLVAPDSFKGSLSAAAVADRIRAGIRRAVPDADVTLAPIADGGEGTAEVLAATLPGIWEDVIATDANGERKTVPYFRSRTREFGDLAIFEVAEVVGLPQAVVEPGLRTTRGVGQVIRAIAGRGVDTIAIGLGGSSTNDAGAGLLAETGFRFTDAEGNALWPCLDALDTISAATYQLSAQLGGVRLIGLSDVNSPLCGPDGATFVFGPQKGVRDLAAVDAKLERFAQRCAVAVGRDLADAEGSGAAGGIGFALRLLGAEMVSGAAFVLGAAGIDAGLGAFHWVITGEGRSDAQTMMGKGPAMIACMARQAGVPVTLLSGAIEPDAALAEAFDGCISIQQGPVSLSVAMANAAALLEDAAFQLTRCYSAASRRGNRRS
ncbi:glycerate kinase [Cupriavidus lacunae]|uniref:Glycerate kinase n=1 Tax=Cupriavidus lacunae TaxID=2666307 RepID=A0A370P0K5_9BURK|nr:glycerate kinase [Cupriavidus lacunae]RDK11390.1 glycerate kinase [Cupriavidus lacunae]